MLLYLFRCLLFHFPQYFNHQIWSIRNNSVHAPFDILLHQFGVIHGPWLDFDILACASRMKRSVMIGMFIDWAGSYGG